MAELPVIPPEGVPHLGHFWIGQPTGLSAYVLFKNLEGSGWVAGTFDAPEGGTALDALRHHFRKVEGGTVLTGKFQVLGKRLMKV